MAYIYIYIIYPSLKSREANGRIRGTRENNVYRKRHRCYADDGAGCGQSDVTLYRSLDDLLPKTSADATFANMMAMAQIQMSALNPDVLLF